MIEMLDRALNMLGPDVELLSEILADLTISCGCQFRRLALFTETETFEQAVRRLDYDLPIVSTFRFKSFQSLLKARVPLRALEER